MAEFNVAFNIVKQNEGGWTRGIGDAGGETYKGVARNYQPKWAGWSIVDKYKPLREGQHINNAQLEQYVANFYYAEFWLPKAKGNLIKNQDLANFLMDTVVNHGSGVKNVINKAINVYLRLFGINDSVPETNTLSEKAIKYLNAYDKYVYPNLIQRRKEYYQENKTFYKYGKGWLARLNLFPKTIAGTDSTINIEGKKKSGSSTTKGTYSNASIWDSIRIFFNNGRHY